ncbi:hypothetical protein Cfor_02809, partial [Coptotermes formosanus]
ETLTGNSSCHLLVYDPDAIMDNMTYTVLEAGKESENISLADVDAELCTAADAESCITVALNIIREIEFIDQPVHSLLLTVQKYSCRFNVQADSVLHPKCYPVDTEVNRKDAEAECHIG